MTRIEQAERCIRLFRPHRWTRWEMVQGKDPGTVVLAQTRRCLRCGRADVHWLP